MPGRGEGNSRGSEKEVCQVQQDLHRLESGCRGQKERKGGGEEGTLPTGKTEAHCVVGTQARRGARTRRASASEETRVPEKGMLLVVCYLAQL